MWKELQKKAVGKKVKWYSDGECGEGTIEEITISKTYIYFKINVGKKKMPVVLGASREHAGIIPSDKDGMFITGGPAGWSIKIPKEGKWK